MAKYKVSRVIQILRFRVRIVVTGNETLVDLIIPVLMVEVLLLCKNVNGRRVENQPEVGSG